MSKLAAFLDARVIGGSYVVPVACEEGRMSYRDIKDLPSFLASAEGIRFTDLAGNYVDVDLEAGAVINKRASRAVDLLPTVKAGDSAEVLLKKLKAGLGSDNSYSLHSIVTSHDLIDLQSLDMTDRQSFHACWQFETSSVEPAGAIYKLQFNSAGLKSIEYRRAKIKTE